MQIVHRGLNQENVHNCILQWNQLTLAYKMTQDHCLAWQSLVVVQISLFGVRFTSLNMTNMRYVSRDLILKIGTLFWTVRWLPGTHCLLKKWSRKSPDLAWKVWILKRMGIQYCIRLRPKWNSILPKGNIVILPLSCRPIQSFIALAWGGDLVYNVIYFLF